MTTQELMSLGSMLDIFSHSAGDLPQIDGLILQGLAPRIPVTRGPDALLVWGWSIVRRAHQLGVHTLDTRELDLALVDATRLALQLENRTGRYSWVEQESVVAVVEKALAAMGPVPPDRDTISRLVRGDGALWDLVSRYRNLDSALQGLVNDGFISLKTAERIGRVPPDFLTGNRDRLERMSFSVRRQYLELLAELIAAALARVAGETSSGSDTRDPVGAVCLQASRILDEEDPVALLRRVRYPQLTRLEQKFAEIRQSTLGGAGVELSAPPYFEGEQFSVTFAIRNCAELEQRIAALERLKGSCDTLFGIL